MLTNLKCKNVSVMNALLFLEYLARNSVSANMMSNYVSVIRARFVVLGLDFTIWEHPNIKYFLKAVKINRPLRIKKKNCD